MKRLRTIFSLLIIIGFTYYSFYNLMPQSGTSASIPETEFSTARALIQLKEITKAPHFVGTEDHERVRLYLIEQLEQLGLNVETQEGFVINTKWISLNNSKNILAKIKGSENGKALLLLTHYDSALTPSFGASDAGSGVVTILESLRAYLASGKIPKNDIIILFTDAEELGLNGAKLFVKKHLWAKEVGLVLNFEARGSGGPSNMIVETNGGNKNLIKAFIDANPEYPLTSSLMYSVYKMLPSDTDSTVFREDGNIDSFFFAFIDDHYDYHTANDTYENLDRNSLQHQGEYLLPLIHYFANADLSSLKSDEDYVYVNIPAFRMISYPFSWISPMLIVAIIMFFGLIFFGIKKRKLQLQGILKGFVPFLLSLVVCGLMGYFGWQLLLKIYPQYNEIQQGFTYNGHSYIAFFVFLTLGILFCIYYRFNKKENAINLLIAPLTIWLIINAAIAIYLKGGAYFIIPVYFGLLSLWLLIRQEKPNLIVMTILGAPAIFLFAPLVQFFPIALGLKMLVISCVFTVLIFGLFLSVFGFYRLRKTISILFLLLALGFLINTHFTSDFSSDRPKPNSLIYYQNADSGENYWATYDKILDVWTQEYLGDSPEEASKNIENASGNKYKKGYRFATKAPKINLPHFNVELKEDIINNGIRNVTFTIIPKRDVNLISLYTIEETTFNTLSFNGENMPGATYKDDSKKIGNKELIKYFVSDNDTLEVAYSIPKDNRVNFIVLEYSFDLLNHAQISITPRPKNMMPKPFVVTDAVVVKKTIYIDSLQIKATDSIIPPIVD